MWNRVCPMCFVKVPRSAILVHPDELVCRSCHTPLELSRTSRVVEGLLGLATGYLAVRSAVSGPGTNFVLPVVVAVLGYGLGSAVFLSFLSDLIVRRPSSDASFPQTRR